jgi:hypothetical protein
MDRASIIRRLVVALEKMRAQGMEVRAIYLTEADWDAYNRAQSKAYGCRLVAFLYGSHEIRPGKSSAIYSTNGVEVAVPKRISHRVEPMAEAAE